MILLFFFSLVTASVFAIVAIGYIISAPAYSGRKSDHFNGKNFINPDSTKAKGLYEVLKWALNRTPGKWIKKEKVVYNNKPVQRITDGIRITFVNHSTFLIQTNGLNILTDPVWSERVSPFNWIGPKRMRPPGTRFEDLPPIDVVLISHNHYDHLDLPTIEKLNNTGALKIITPLGVKAFLDKKNITGVFEYDWWDEVPLSDSLSVQLVPAQHFSGRGMFDRDATLWCGYVIKRAGGNIYFAGDTGYNDQTFKEIKEKSDPIAVALLPIGAYKPQWFMSPIHTSPSDAVKIHLDIDPDVSIGMHYGTFPLADDGQQDPLSDLQAAKRESGILENSFIVLPEGDYYEHEK